MVSVKGTSHPTIDESLLSFGRRLRTLRASRRETLERVSGRIDMDPGQLSRIESGRGAVTLSTLWRLAEAYQCPLSEMFAPDEVLTAASPTSHAEAKPEDHSPDTLAARLSRNMARLRALHGLNQRELARRAGVGLSVVSGAEARRTSPSLRSIALIAQALEVSAPELLS